jgi:hypothetical protein
VRVVELAGGDRLLLNPKTYKEIHMKTYMILKLVGALLVVFSTLCVVGSICAAEFWEPALRYVVGGTISFVLGLVAFVVGRVLE